MLAIQLFFLRQFNAVVDISPARISQYDSSVVGFACLWGIELFHIYLAGAAAIFGVKVTFRSSKKRSFFHMVKIHSLLLQ